jgi:uncharacterized protein (DUF2141 family)
MNNHWLAMILWLLAISPVFSQTGTVIFEVDGIDLKRGGDLSSGVFLEPGFPKVGKQFRGQATAITSSTMKVEFKDLPAGVYAAAIYQDIDKNSDLKTNWIGLPQEPIGFSNNVRIKMGPPSFADAQFQVQPNKTVTLKITLR